jgi:sugar fermentation stimulation protein A
MRIPGPLLQAQLLERENRFRARVGLGDRKVHAHLPNPGRLPELIYPGAEVYVRPVENPLRKTKYDLVLVRHRRIYCCLDTQLANDTFHEALMEQWIPEFSAYPAIEREKVYGKSRLDFVLSGPRSRILIEVKSASLAIKGHARFPDAPTIRGAKHVRELAAAARRGEEAWVVFVCQRRDPRSISPNEETDPDFAGAMREARDAGVGFMALTCRVTRRFIRITDRIPVLIDGKNCSGAGNPEGKTHR